MTQQTAVEWLFEELNIWQTIADEDTNATLDTVRKLLERAKQMEKEQKRQKLIGLLDWMNKVATDNPMAFETDHDDIVDMYLTGYYK